LSRVNRSALTRENLRGARWQRQEFQGLKFQSSRFHLELRFFFNLELGTLELWNF